MIARTEHRHQALRDVAHHEVDFFPGLRGGHPQGFGWHNGGEIPADEQLVLSELVIVRLVATVPAVVQRQIGCEVVLTGEGVRVLSDWDRQAGGAW